MSGPCAKQTVTATIVTASGERFVGTNACRKPQKVCPRAGMATGVGYHLCREICQQDAHAEVAAIRAAGDKARGATLYLDGHTYLCGPCEVAAFEAGIKKVIFGAAP